MNHNVTISARLVGPDDDNGRVRFDDFRVFCDKLSECVHRVEKAITNERAKISFRITSLESKSAGMTIEAIPPKHGEDRRGEAVELFTNTINNIMDGRGVDPRLTFDDLRAFREMYVSLRKTKELWFREREITNQYVENIDIILGNTFRSEGSVKGTLEGLNVHNKSECVLYPPIRGIRVTCAFPENLFEQVRAAIKKNVTVFGTLYHKPDKGFPERVEIKEILVHDTGEQVVTLASLKGTFGDCTEGLGALDFVRKLRKAPMPTPLVELHLCCNHHKNGMFLGICRSLSLRDPEDLTLDSPWIGRSLKCEIGPRHFRLGKSHTWSHHGHHTWVGNWVWDSVSVIPACAADVLNFAISKNYQVMVASGSLIRRTEHNEPITAMDILMCVR